MICRLTFSRLRTSTISGSCGHDIPWYVVSYRSYSTRFSVKYRGDLKKLEEFPLFPTPADMSSSLGPEKLPSVTHILSQTEPSENAYRLMMWRQRKINEMGRAAFLEYQNNMLNSGSTVHKAIERYMLGDDVDGLIGDGGDQVQGYWKSVCDELAHITDVKCTEHRLSHGALLYTGAIDCIARYRDRSILLIDWKTAQKKKSSAADTYSQPVQVAAYAGLWNYNNPEQQVESGMLVVMYPDGTPSDKFIFEKADLLSYWRVWTGRLKEYWKEEVDNEPDW